MKEKTTFLTKALTLLFVMLFSLTGARAEELTVYDGTATSQHVPAYMLYFDDYAKSQFIIPATQLSVMKGGIITAVKFYANGSPTYTSPQVLINLQEVNNTTFGNNPNFVTGGTTVYTGTLSMSSSELTITFSSSYTYNGGNLLISVENTVTGGYKSVSFLGQEVSNAACYNSNSDGTPTQGRRESFIPKTTFTYTPAITNVTASDIGYNKATISWDGNNANATRYNLRYRAINTFTCDFESVEAWSVDALTPFTTYDGDGSSTYSINNTTFTNQGYTGSVITMQNGVGGSFTAHAGNQFGCFFDATTPPNNDFIITPEITIENGSEFKFWARSLNNRYGLERIKVGIYGGNGTISTYLAGSNSASVEVPTNWTEYSYDLSSYVGQTIQLAINCVSNDAFALLIDDISVGSVSSWEEKTSITATTYQLEGLTPETSYEVQVQAVYAGGVSEWSNSATFTTKPLYVLENDKSNKDLIERIDGETCCIVLANRTLKKNGNWNTLCLPFNVELTGDFAGADVRTLDTEATVLTDDHLKLKIKPVDTTVLSAGTPYLIRWQSGDDIVEPLFVNVTVTKEMHNVSCNFDGGKSVTFKGNYESLAFTGVDQTVLFISNNKLYYVGNESKIYPHRAYFQVEGLDGNSIKQMVLDMSEDDPDGIDDVNANFNDDESIYNVAGQRLGKMQKGINIVNGKKIIVK